MMKIAQARSTALLSLLLASACVMAAPPTPVHDAGPASAQGKVLETKNVEGYTYLKLQTATGEVWAAVPTSDVKPGAQVTISHAMTMQDFESKTLKRKFDKIIFGQLVDGKATAGGAGGMAAHSGMAGMAGMPGMGASISKAPAAVKPVAKASGADAKTVAEVVAGKAGLKDKTVSLRAQVVKVNNGIMGKNWLHLQDGSGSAKDGSNDLIVTSKDTAALGDVVTVRGVVRTNVDLGSGYAYQVLIEDASVRK
jgi:hypothetical protein